MKSREGHAVGGAERTEDKRKRQAARAVTAARGGGGGSRGMIVGVALVVLLALVVGFAVWAQNHHKKGALPVAIPVAPAAGVQYPVAVQGDAIVTGSPHAPVTIDIYEDFMCPVCGQFEKLYHQRLEQAAADGKAKVVYHPVNILKDYSVPPGYSTLAAGASLCAAQAGIFPRFHDSLFEHQPTEDGPGWTVANLQQLGRALGAGGGFGRCVQAGAQQRIDTSTENASRYLRALEPDHTFGTPTVLVNGKLISISDPNWLNQALNGARH
jgi:protein-disulfide isomerase